MADHHDTARAKLPYPLCALAFYAIYGLGFFILLTLVLNHYPLFPLDTDNIHWARSWLFTTVFDYYGAALCLCGIILSTEGLVVGGLWSLGCCLLGTPVCCIYMMYRIHRFRTLKLMTPENDYHRIQQYS
mmetsp:Transcript_27693/g.53842  ORF Transcript_27693/g.53842 Transcript_27693/m.53842 type:complete len:130 (+) Transcript_27693:52-441(+)